MIVVLNDYIRGVVSNEETLFSRLSTELPNAVGISFAELKVSLESKLSELKPSLIIQNAMWGKLSDFKTISFLQDPLVEMSNLLEPWSLRLRAKIMKRGVYQEVIKKQFQSLEKSIKVTNSHYMAEMYKKAGKFKVIPMGVDQELFKPMNKTELRKKYNIPLGKEVRIFVGSTHPVKGYDLIQKMITENPSIFWILVLKDKNLPSGHNYITFHQISQSKLAELYNCADLFVSRSRTESFGLSMTEAMFCGIPVDSPKTGVFWDWNPPFNNPRKEASDHDLDINSCIENWKKFTEHCLELDKVEEFE